MKEIPAAGLSEAALNTIALENSGRSAALSAVPYLLGTQGLHPVVVAGQGGVGAAALVAARHLFNWGLNPEIYIVGMTERLREGSAAGLELLRRYGARWQELLSSEQVAALVEGMPIEAPLVFGATGDAESNRASEMADLINRLGTEREASFPTVFSVRVRSRPPVGSEPRMQVEAAARDREAMRLFDSTAIKEYGMPSLGLMENAGFWAARELWLRLEKPSSASVAVIAGKGNNGGDGFVVARHLAWWGIGSVKVYLAGSGRQLIDDARANYEYLSAPNVACEELAVEGEARRFRDEIARADWIVDALLGTGLNGQVRGLSREMLEMVSGLDRPVLAVDTPSGLDATDGSVHGMALKAACTVTFGVPKLGFEIKQGPDHVGELVVAEISLPPKITGAGISFAIDGDRIAGSETEQEEPAS